MFGPLLNSDAQLCFFLIDFCLNVPSTFESGEFNSHTTIVWQFTSPFRFADVCFKYLGAWMLDTYIFIYLFL